MEEEHLLTSAKCKASLQIHTQEKKQTSLCNDESNGTWRTALLLIIQ
jgi:hypothetical protein